MRLLGSILAAQLNKNLLSSTINGKPIDLAPLALATPPVDLRYLCYGQQGNKKELDGGAYLRWRGRLLPLVRSTCGNLGGIGHGVSLPPGCADILPSRSEYQL